MAVTIVTAACGSSASAPTPPLVVDGSSTLAPLTKVIVAEFQKTHRATEVKLTAAGTVEGFRRFCRGEVDIADASRPVNEAERSACGGAGVEFVELPVAYDALTVVVHPQNDWAQSMTVLELRKLWEPAAEGKVTTWNQVRNDWPDRPIKLFGPGTESGTFDYFTEAVNGTVDVSRKDYTASAFDEAIVSGVAADVDALGYVGYSQFDKARATLKAVAIDDGDDRVGRGPIAPSPEAVGRGVYRPFARPMFVYVNKARLERPEVKTFVETYLRRALEVAGAAGAIPLTGASYQLASQRLVKGVTGTMYRTPDDAKLGLDLLMNR
jgi:phosphate transport system substrate-binding protein